MGPSAAILPDGKRLHLQHGPIDLIIGADGDREGAFRAAQERFQTVLQEVVDELAILRSPVGNRAPKGETALRMYDAATSFSGSGFVTPMAAVAGSVAETILAAMAEQANLTRAYVNNGGDIALYLTKGQSFEAAISTHDGQNLGRVSVTHDMPVRGIATSARHGRSLSMGIADSVTVLAETASVADVAATLIANQIDLPGHPAIQRRPACEIDEASDLGWRSVVTGRGPLSQTETTQALTRGAELARHFIDTRKSRSALMMLDGQIQTIGDGAIPIIERTPIHA